MPAIIGGLIAGGGSLLGGILGSNAQSQAAQQEIAAQEQALKFQEGVYGTATSNLDPYIGTGTNALYSLASLYGLPGAPGQPNTGQGASAAFANYASTPAYTFALGQGNLGANRALAASGLTASGAQAKALSQYNQGYASQGFGNYINQLASLAGMGQSSATSLGQIGEGVGSQVGNSLGAIGAAGAAGTIGSTGSLLGGIGGLTGALSNNNFLSGLGLNSSNGLAALLGGGTSSYSTNTLNNSSNPLNGQS